MKQDAPGHPKMETLAESINERIGGISLSMSHTLAVGLMEKLWNYATKYVQAGDIGKVPNVRVARILGWSTEADKADWLIDTLVECGWLDRSETHRLIIHDWPEHCQDSVHMWLARKVEHFASGQRPKLTKLNKDDRQQIIQAFQSKEGEAQINSNCAHKLINNAPDKRTNGAVGAHCPAQPSPAIAQPLPRQDEKPPLTPPASGGMPVLEFALGREPRRGYRWDRARVDKFLEQIYHAVPPEAFEIISGLSSMVTTKDSCYLPGCPRAPDDFKPDLQAAIAAALPPEIKTIILPGNMNHV